MSPQHPGLAGDKGVDHNAGAKQEDYEGQDVKIEILTGIIFGDYPDW